MEGCLILRDKQVPQQTTRVQAALFVDQIPLLLRFSGSQHDHYRTLPDVTLCGCVDQRQSGEWEEGMWFGGGARSQFESAKADKREKKKTRGWVFLLLATGSLI